MIFLSNKIVSSPQWRSSTAGHFSGNQWQVMVTFVQIFLALLVCLFDNRHFSVQFWKSIDCRSLLPATKCQFFINPFTFKQCRVCFGKLAWRKAGGLISESFSIVKKICQIPILNLKFETVYQNLQLSLQRPCEFIVLQVCSLRVVNRF